MCGEAAFCCCGSVSIDLLCLVGVRWQYMLAVFPLMHGLVIKISIWLWQKPDETAFDTELLCTSLSILGAPGTPKIENDTSGVQRLYTRHDNWHGNALRPNGSNQSVIDVDENNARFHEV
jgi:hypothetical protein